MPKRDSEHFEGYSPQTGAKHAILKGYLRAYLRALKNQVKWYHYVDGFAGRGHYDNQQIGSPLLALQILIEEGIAGRTSTSFVEKEEVFFHELDRSLDASGDSQQLFDSPLRKQGAFHEHIDTILHRPIYSQPGRVATFAFVDPCGVEGVRMGDLRRLLELPFGEVLLFFNYDGVNRLIGGLAAGTHDRQILDDLFGDADCVTQLINDLRAIDNPLDRELIIRDAFVGCLRRNGRVRFLMPFRFEAKSKQRTSHYIIHCCNDPLGFKIMKDVMWETGRDETDSYGRIEFLNDRERGQQFTLIRCDIEERKSAILDRLALGACRAGLFKEEWPSDPNDALSERVYRRILIDLETAGRVIVYDKNNEHPRPANRRMRGGKVTLGSTCWIRLA